MQREFNKRKYQINRLHQKTINLNKNIKEILAHEQRSKQTEECVVSKRRRPSRTHTAESEEVTMEKATTEAVPPARILKRWTATKKI